MGKTALITGASSGIGYELARVMAREGYDLCLLARSLDKLNDIKKELETKYDTWVLVLPGDLSVPGIANQVYNEIKEKEIAIDVLVNNAGFGEHGKFTETNWKKESDMLQVNIVALTQLTKLFVKDMVDRQSGYVMNISSVAAYMPGPLMAVYHATKGYVSLFSEALSNELKGTGVTVTCLCPGPTESGFQEVANNQDTVLVKIKTIPTSAQVAEFAYKAMINEKNVAIHGVFNNLLVFSGRFMPRNLTTSIVRKMQEQKP